jgi:hypothetical protein
MELLGIDKLSNTKFKEQKQFYDYLMFEMQSRIVDIDDCKCSKDDINSKKVAADMAIIARLIAMNEGVTTEIMEQRLVEIQKKIKT